MSMLSYTRTDCLNVLTHTHTEICCQIFIQKIADRRIKSTSDLTICWIPPDDSSAAGNIMNSSTHHHAVSRLVLAFFSPSFNFVCVVFFWDFWRLLITSKKYLQCAAAFAWPCQFLFLPTDLYLAGDCSLTCHKPQVER